MATKLLLNVSAPGSPDGVEVTVRETFDEVIDRIWPVRAESSALEARMNAIYTEADGTRIMIHRNTIVTALEES